MVLIPASYLLSDPEERRVREDAKMDAAGDAIKEKSKRTLRVYRSPKSKKNHQNPIVYPDSI